MEFNDEQLKAVNAIKKLINSEVDTFSNSVLVLLGPAGTGKTTVVTTALTGANLHVAFCAFTNKATQVLKNMSKVDINMDFHTIHKLLQLKIIVDVNDNIDFIFSTGRIADLADYDVIIIDECSTINGKLYKYLVEAWHYIYNKFKKVLKFIFLGDYWQLPPINELNSIVFYSAIHEKFKVVKLNKIMRCKNEKLRTINENFLKYVEYFKQTPNEHITNFIKEYPYNLAPDRNLYCNSLENVVDYYLSNDNSIVLTYSRGNCRTINYIIQDEIDIRCKRELQDLHRESLRFYVGDKCTIVTPIEVCEIKTKKDCVLLGETLGITLYNGEIFEVIECEDVRCITELNGFRYAPKYFNAQLITCKKGDEIYKIIHVDYISVEKIKKTIKFKEKRQKYIDIMTCYYKKHPKLEYGYCLTIYKSQGSEWKNVVIALNSIFSSMTSVREGREKLKSSEIKQNIFRSTYTAVSRASENVLLYWFNQNRR
jgi:DNA polymerase III delta prime subunit